LAAKYRHSKPVSLGRPKPRPLCKLSQNLPNSNFGLLPRHSLRRPVSARETPCFPLQYGEQSLRRLNRPSPRRFPPSSRVCRVRTSCRTGAGLTSGDTRPPNRLVRTTGPRTSLQASPSPPRRSQRMARPRQMGRSGNAGQKTGPPRRRSFPACRAHSICLKTVSISVCGFIEVLLTGFVQISPSRHFSRYTDPSP
jgi:hypothetical protein